MTQTPKKDKKHDREASILTDSDKKDKERETRLPACEACRSRKVKCDALLPACTPCQKSGRECYGRDKVPNVSRGLVYELQQKVKDLESRLALASSGVKVLSVTNGDAGRNAAGERGRRSSHAGLPSAKRAKRGRNGHSSFDHSAQSQDSDQASSSSDSMSTSPEPADPSPNDFVQQTSTILESLSSDLTASTHRPTQSTPERPSTQTLDNDEASALAALTRHHRDRTRSPHRLKRRSSSNASKYRDEAIGHFSASSSTFHHLKPRSRSGRVGTISAYDRSFFDRLIARYLTYMNTALSVINEVRMWEIAGLVYQDDERARLAALSMGSHSSMPPPPLPSSPSVDRMTLSRHRYVVLMALAIALASLGRSHNFSPELRRLGHQYWAEAQALHPLIFRTSDLDKLRASLLQLQYALLVPTAGSVWELSGAAMRLVTELNLQVDREFDTAANAPFTQETIDLRRRLFWTTYCLDRSLAVALARPPGLSDAWIHVQQPTLQPDAELVRPDRKDAASTDGGRTDPLKEIFRSHINLRRIQSEILCRLHSVNPRDYSLDHDGVSSTQSPLDRPSLALVMEVGPPTPNVEWQTRMMDKLVEWRSEYDRIRLGPLTSDRLQQNEGISSTATPFITRDWIDLNHNLTISLLFRPSPNNPRPDSFGLQQAFMASGRAMKIYKSMHRSSTINFPWLATHHLFISGLTHLNALEKLTRTGATSPSPVVEVVFNVQSCASTLEALTSRDDGYGTKIRETFDAAASAVLRSVLEPNARTSEMGLDVEELIRGSPRHRMRSPHRHQDALLGVAQQQQQQQHHPGWLSDSTWNSMGAMEAGPPPGSTIFVAAPPRTARFGTGHSLVPTLSERTTQTVGTRQHMQGASTMGALQTTGHSSPRGSFALQTPYNLTTSTLAFNNSDAFNVGDAANNNSHSATSSVETSTAERTSSTFGFHNWLLQPYEGGSDLSQALSSHSNVNGGNPFNGGGANAFLFNSSPSAYTGVDMTYSDGMTQQHGRADMGGAKETAADASTLLDFFNMLPSGSPPAAAAGKVSTNGSARG
ncbi:C6 transcription factor [Pseudozyma hubeiensis SY62]|uniref:C6 transcription factor n=1 Tax=Pseudozyma hubeiensis (strain SY62) TaxID=1305764 RepID=R9P4E2_PSEHS|nr:C6 transcription factor [Pseudozyma hubeiensis SY62]GAC96122.1 C6 transcription factor [Pseudozyma hubeiensis SY62]